MLAALSLIIDAWASLSNTVLRPFFEYSCCGLKSSSMNLRLNMVPTISWITKNKKLSTQSVFFIKLKKLRAIRAHTVFSKLNADIDIRLAWHFSGTPWPGQTRGACTRKLGNGYLFWKNVCFLVMHDITVSHPYIGNSLTQCYSDVLGNVIYQCNVMLCNVICSAMIFIDFMINLSYAYWNAFLI